MQSVKTLLRAKQEKLEGERAVQGFWDRLRKGLRTEVRQTLISDEEVRAFRKTLKVEGCAQYKRYSDTEIRFMMTIGTPFGFLREQDYKEGVLEEREGRKEKALMAPPEMPLMHLDGSQAMI